MARSVYKHILIGMIGFFSTHPLLALEVKHVISPVYNISAWLAEDHTNPIIGMSLVFKAGSKFDSLGKEGLAVMTASLLDEGAGDKDSRTFNADLEDHGIKLNFQSTQDTITGHLLTLTENQQLAADMLKMALSQPRFEAKEIEKIRNKMLTSIKNLGVQPNYLVGTTLFEKIFPNHPYGRKKLGDSKSLASITREDIVNFHKNLTLDRLVIAVTGDITAAQLGKMLDHIFQGLEKKAPAREPVPDIEPALDGSTIVKNFNVPQATLLCLQKGVGMKDPRFSTLMILDHILGGGTLQSRLHKEVREKRGLAYAIHSGFKILDHAQLLSVYGGTENAKADQTLSLVREQWQNMKDRGITSEELEDAKKYLIGSYALNFTETPQICNILLQYQLDGLTIDYITNRNKYIQNVTLEEANALAKTFFTPDKLTCVAVGKPQNLVK